MSFKDQLAADAESVFCNADEFAEQVTYTKRNGQSRTISAIIDRDPVSVATGGTFMAKMLVHVPNSAAGIQSSEVNVGGDTLTVAYRIGGAAQAFQIHWPKSGPTHDHGMLTLELR